MALIVLEAQAGEDPGFSGRVPYGLFFAIIFNETSSICNPKKFYRWHSAEFGCGGVAGSDEKKATF